MQKLKFTEPMGLTITKIAHEDEILPIITETDIKYKKPFYLSNKVHVEVWVSEMFNISSNFRFRFLNENEEVCALAQQKVLFIDKATQRPSRKIVKYKENFERFYIPE